MSKPRTLVDRLHAAFDARKKRRTPVDRPGEAQERNRVVDRFNEVCDLLRAHWEPKLAALSEHFRDMLKATPTITPDRRQVQVALLTDDVANMTMTLSASLSRDMRKVVIDYGLLIIPTFFEYERSARLEIPLDAPDMDQVERWVDDRLMAFVNAYFSAQDNRFYTKIIERLMVAPGV